MFTKWALGGGLAFLLLAGGAGMTASAQNAAPAANGRGGPLRTFLEHERAVLTQLRSDLDLSVDQKQQIHQILLANRAAIAADAGKPLVEQFRALRSAIAGGDEATIRAAAKDLSDPIGVLDDQQRAKWERIFQDFTTHWLPNSAADMRDGTPAGSSTVPAAPNHAN